MHMFWKIKGQDMFGANLYIENCKLNDLNIYKQPFTSQNKVTKHYNFDKKRKIMTSLEIKTIHILKIKKFKR